MRIIEESNRYAAQADTNKPLNLTSDELEQLIGILFLMSVMKMQVKSHVILGNGFFCMTV